MANVRHEPATPSLIRCPYGATATEKSAIKLTLEELYQAIKARVIAYEFAQGRRINLESLAPEYGVSNSPVRKVMKRLAAEGLVIKAPRRGYIAPTLSEPELLGQYALTRVTLCDALVALDRAERTNPTVLEPIAELLERLNRRTIADGKALARYTGDFFAHSAELTCDTTVCCNIERANDRLYFLRTIENHFLEDVQYELKHLCELTLAGHYEHFSVSMHAYYDRRTTLLPTLLEFVQQ